MEASRFGDAEAIYQKLVGLTPADPIAHMQLGMARAMGGKTADAIGPLREALRLRPDLLPAKLFLGISYMELGRPKDAVGPLRQVVQADKDNANARQALAEALLTLEQFAEASTQLEALVVSQPQSPQVWAALGRSYEGVAREAFAKLQALDADSPYVWLLAADVMTVEEKYPQAFSLIRKAQVALADAPRRASHARACVRRERPRRLGRRRAEARRGRAAVLRHGAGGVRLPDREAGGRDRAHGVGVATGGVVLEGTRCQRSRRAILRDVGEAAAVGGAVRGASGYRPRPEPAARGRDAVA